MSGLDHEQARLSLGSYVLGALSPAERATVDRHLPGCATCREELASCAGLPGLMSRLTLTEVREGTLVAPPVLLDRTLAAVAAQRRTETGRLRRWRLATVAVTAVAVVAAVTLAVRGLPAGPPARTEASPAMAPLTTLPGTSATGSAGLRGKAWGTAVHLELRGLPRTGTFTAWVESDDGRRTTAATWGATADGRAVLDGSTSLALGQLASVVVAGGDGQPLLRVDP